MATVAQRWSLTALAVEFGVNYRTIAKRLARVEPVGTNGHGAPVYLLLDAARAVFGSDGLRPPDLNLERTRLAREQADKVAIQNARLRNELLPADDVVAGWENAIIRCRELLLTIPAAVTDEIMGLARSGDRGGVHALLEDRIRGALMELANTTIEAEEDEESSDEPSPSS